MKLIKKSDPRQVKDISLGNDPYVDNLYGCFRFDNPKIKDSFADVKTVEIVANSGNQITVSVPAAMKINLPSEHKLPDSGLLSFSSAAENLDTMMLLSMRAGWNQLESDMTRMCALDPDGSLVARINVAGESIPVSTGAALPLGDNDCWIGMILVHPELRRQGLAGEMMLRLLACSIEKGKVINGLDATPMGNTVYGALGYRESYRLWRCIFPTAQFWRRQDLPGVSVRRAEEKDLEAIIAYDSTRWLYRENVIRALWRDSEEESWLALDKNDNLCGYLLARPGRLRYFVGPLVADSREAAGSLLTQASSSLSSKGVADAMIDTPECRFANPGTYDKTLFDQPDKPKKHEIIEELKPVRDFVRMYQAADERQAEELTAAFMAKEKLDPLNERVKIFGKTMRESVRNCSRTLAFMEYEEKVLQHKYIWGSSGPEKG